MSRRHGGSWGRGMEKRRHVRLDHALLESAAFRSLSPNARALLIEIAMLENGKNNGELFMSVRDAADRIGVGDPHTAAAAFEELEGAGFIACTLEAHFAVKAGAGSRARCWRITWQSVPSLSAGPTNDYERWQACDPRSRRRSERGAGALKRYKGKGAGQRGDTAELQSAVRNFHTLNAERVRKSHTTPAETLSAKVPSVQKDHTRFEENGQNLPKLVVQDSHTHTTGQLVRPAGEGAATPSCEECGDAFQAGSRGKPKRFCGEPCRKKAERDRYRARTGRSANDDTAVLPCWFNRGSAKLNLAERWAAYGGYLRLAA